MYRCTYKYICVILPLSSIHYNGILDPFDKPYLLTLLKRSCNVDEPCIKTQQKEKKIKKSQKNIFDFYNRKKKIKKKIKFPFSHNIFVPWTRNRSIRSNHFFCTFRRQRTINHSLHIPKHKQTNNTHTKNKTRRRKKNISTKKKTQNKNNTQHKKKKSSFHILLSTTHLFILRQRVFPSTISFKTTTPIPTLIPLNPNPTISIFFIKFISSMRH